MAKSVLLLQLIMGFIGQLAKNFGTVAALQKCFSGAGARLQATTVLGLQ